MTVRPKIEAELQCELSAELAARRREWQTAVETAEERRKTSEHAKATADRELRELSKETDFQKGALEKAQFVLEDREKLMRHAKEMWMKESARAAAMADGLDQAERRISDLESQMVRLGHKYDDASKEAAQLKHMLQPSAGGFPSAAPPPNGFPSPNGIARPSTRAAFEKDPDGTFHNAKSWSQSPSQHRLSSSTSLTRNSDASLMPFHSVPSASSPPHPSSFPQPQLITSSPSFPPSFPPSLPPSSAAALSPPARSPPPPSHGGTYPQRYQPADLRQLPAVRGEEGMAAVEESISRGGGGGGWTGVVGGGRFERGEAQGWEEEEEMRRKAGGGGWRDEEEEREDRMSLEMPSEEEERQMNRFRHLVQFDDNVLYEDDTIQIGLKAQYSSLSARLLLFTGNKGRGVLQNVAIQLLSPPSSALSLLPSPTPSLIAPAQQVVQQLAVACSGPFDEPPVMRLQFLLPDNSPRVLQLRLPVVVSKFMESCELTVDQFMKLWTNEFFVLKEVSSVCNLNPRLVSHLVDIARCAQLGSALEMNHKVDPNPQNLVLMGQFPPSNSDRDMPVSVVLVRLEVGTGRYLGKARLAVRSDSHVLARAIRNLIVNQIGLPSLPMRHNS
eukprot:GHVS01052799.1.p1 GENE.GHVS01052799.1~~GHVS01052799.1.p1  ORF type:complete len:616 (+),score=157.35 GHVS01052799.1:144-1991(+)